MPCAFDFYINHADMPLRATGFAGGGSALTIAPPKGCKGAGAMVRVNNLQAINPYTNILEVTDASLTMQGPLSFFGAAANGDKVYRPLKFSGDKRFSLKITSVYFSSCFSPGDGGALHASGGAPVSLTQNGWRDNSASGAGGAVAVVAGPLTIKGDSFVNNAAANGGALAMLTQPGDAGEGAPLALTILAGAPQKGDFTRNSATAAGGALFISSYSTSSLVVSVASKVSITDNKAPDGDGLTSGLGGFAAVEQGPDSGAVELACKPSCSFSNNHAIAGSVVAVARKAATKVLTINLGKATKFGGGWLAAAVSSLGWAGLDSFTIDTTVTPPRAPAKTPYSPPPQSTPTPPPRWCAARCSRAFKGAPSRRPWSRCQPPSASGPSATGTTLPMAPRADEVTSVLSRNLLDSGACSPVRGTSALISLTPLQTAALSNTLFVGPINQRFTSRLAPPHQPSNCTAMPAVLTTAHRRPICQRHMNLPHYHSWHPSHTSNVPSSLETMPTWQPLPSIIRTLKHLTGHLRQFLTASLTGQT
jgi:hypothetical protein